MCVGGSQSTVAPTAAPRSAHHPLTPLFEPPGWSQDPTLLFKMGDWRGVHMGVVAVAEGLLIGVVYTETFTALAKWIAYHANTKSMAQYERLCVNFVYPFELGATCFYYWILCFVFVPFMSTTQGWLFSNEHAISLQFNESLVYEDSGISLLSLRRARVHSSNSSYSSDDGMPVAICGNGTCTLEGLMASDLISRWQCALPLPHPPSSHLCLPTPSSPAPLECAASAGLLARVFAPSPQVWAAI